MAVEDARRVIDFGSQTRNAEHLLGGLALRAQADATIRTPASSDALDRFYREWEAIGGMPSVAHSLAELAPITSPADRIREAAARLPSLSRWKQALMAMAEHRYADAAQVYREIGSRPLEAQAHLLAASDLAGRGETQDATRHARRAAAFCRQVGATLYLPDAERLLEGYGTPSAA